MPEAEIRVADFRALRTRSGHTRFVVRDENGNEYSTFKEQIAAKLPGLEGSRARISFHEQQRDGFTNVYLDDIEPLEAPEPAQGAHADEVAWKTAIDAAPYLLSAEAVDEETPPGELFDKLQPFKELVAEDIEREDDDA
jgi:hypothetical protein